MSCFTFYMTDSEGNRVGELEARTYQDIKRFLSLRYPGKLSDLQHFIDLSAAAPRHPVDVTAFDPRSGALIFSGRLEFFPGVVRIEDLEARRREPSSKRGRQ